MGRRPADDLPGARTTRWVGWLLAAAAGASTALAFPRPSLDWAAWFLLVPWLLLIRRAATVREAALRGWWAALGFLVAVDYWLAPSTTLFLPVVAALIALPWLVWGALAWHLLQAPVTVGRFAVAVVVLPAGWVLTELARSWSALGGPWALLGTSQWRTPVELASAAVGGVWLVSYLVVAANVALAVVVVAVQRRVRLVALGGLAIAVGAGPLAFLLLHAPVGSRTIPIAVVQAGVIHGPQQRLAAEIAATQALPSRQWGLVIWGESSVGIDLAGDPSATHRLEATSASVGADLLVNVDAATPSGAISKTSVLLDADGILSSYQKMRLVPFGEYIPMRSVLGWLSSLTSAAAADRVPGHHLVVMRADGAAFAPLICFEAAFPDMSRNAVRAGAQFLVYQSATTTFQGTWEPDQQAGLAAVRAVETGRPAIAATLAGTTAAFDAQGRRLLWHPQSRGTSMVPLRLAQRTTPFDRLGDWGVPVGLAVSALIGVTVAVTTSGPGRRTRRFSTAHRAGTIGNPDGTEPSTRAAPIVASSATDAPV